MYFPESNANAEVCDSRSLTALSVTCQARAKALGREPEKGRDAELQEPGEAAQRESGGGEGRGGAETKQHKDISLQAFPDEELKPLAGERR